MAFGGYYSREAAALFGITPPDSGIPDISLCRHCTNPGSDRDQRIALPNGSVIRVGFGSGQQLLAWTEEHQPIKPVYGYELTDALTDWVLKRDFTREALVRIKFAHTSVYGNNVPPFHPTVTTLAWVGEETKKATEKHRAVYTNVFKLHTYGEWPQVIADRQAIEAQRMVGYFYGRPVISGQMSALGSDEHGVIRDASVRLLDEEWAEPFDISDDCVFCQKMTDESVRDRVAGFQWAIDKETFGRNGGVYELYMGFDGVPYPHPVPDNRHPNHEKYDDSYEQRAEYHRLLDEWEAENPAALKTINLLALPLRLQRILVIRWNHIVRDYLKADTRYCYDDGDYYVIWTERKGGIEEGMGRTKEARVWS